MSSLTLQNPTTSITSNRKEIIEKRPKEMNEMKYEQKIYTSGYISDNHNRVTKQIQSQSEFQQQVQYLFPIKW